LLALDNAKLFLANEAGDCNEIKVVENNDPIKVIHCYVDRASFFLITESMELIQVNIIDGVMVPGRNMKLSVQLNFERDTLLSPHGHLICMTGKGTVQCFDLNNYENYELKVPPDPHEEDAVNSDRPVSIASNNKFIATYSQSKRCTFWGFDAESKEWAIVASTNVDAMNNSIGAYLKFANNSLVIISKSNVSLVIEQYSLSANADDLVALQTGLGTITIFNEEDKEAFAVLDTGMIVKGMSMDMKHICVWSANDIHIYKIDGHSQCELISEIASNAQSVAIYENSLFIAKESSLLVTDLCGVQRLTICLSAEEGKLIFLETSCDKLAIMTSLGTVKTMDISSKEPKLLTAGYIDLGELFSHHSHVISVKCNADATIMSILSETSSSTRQIHVFDTKKLSIVALENIFGNDNLITGHCWDPVFPRLFACETRSKMETKSRILTLFVSENLSINVHTDNNNIRRFLKLISINVPSRLFVSKVTAESGSLNVGKLFKTPLEGYEDLEATTSAESLSALVDFDYYLTVSDLDKAYFCILQLKNNATWFRLAKVSIAQNRVDIAERCLVKLGNGLGVAAVRKADKEVALAEAAIQLGMLNEAENLYKQWDRHDLLCDLYRRQDRWREAFSIANSCTTEQSLKIHHNQKLEFSGQQDEFLSNNASSFASKKAKLKQLILSHNPVDSYLRQENDLQLFQWYAAYIESTGDLRKAKELYDLTCDTLSLVRIACLEGNLTDAFTLVRESKSCVAAYHLARHLEANGDIEGAISCFARSGKYNYAIRLAKAHGIEKSIMNFALQSEQSLRVECANYLKSIGQIEKAAELFIKGGEKKKALDLFVQIPFDKCNRLQFDIVSIVNGLEDEVPQDIIIKCAINLMRSGEHSNAFQLLHRKGHDFSAFLNLYLEKNIPLLESVINEVLMYCTENVKNKHLNLIGSICKAQGNYTLACDKFTEGGDFSSAIKSLILTGDVKSIISYALSSDTKEVFIIAANYLQTM
jgi:intraflagellar transport protein 140